jgi:hypothetical protein
MVVKYEIYHILFCIFLRLNCMVRPEIIKDNNEIYIRIHFPN